jgi:hypothetical protein
VFKTAYFKLHTVNTVAVFVHYNFRLLHACWTTRMNSNVKIIIISLLTFLKTHLNLTIRGSKRVHIVHIRYLSQFCQLLLLYQLFLDNNIDTFCYYCLSKYTTSFQAILSTVGRNLTCYLKTLLLLIRVYLLFKV